MLVPLTILLCNYVLAYDGESRLYYNLDEAKDYFSWFINKYNKVYTPQEADERFQNFINNLKTINEKNSGLSEPVFGITSLSDLSVDEFKKFYTGLKFGNDNELPEYCLKKNYLNLQTGSVPDAFDWRAKNVVTKVKDQARCGSCWAFSAAANIESAYAIKTGKLIDLSTQELVDCDDLSSGCWGGFPSSAMKKVIEIGGIEKWSDYPYIANDGSFCDFDQSKVAVKLKGCTAFKATEEKAREILFNNGPLTICIHGDEFHHYQKGILPNCSQGPIDHAVLLVGYGTENGQDYWIIKNSWGENWGENGYVRIKRGENACNINNYYYEVAEIAD